MPEFSATSKRRLLTCDDRLQALFNRVIEVYDCSIVCGFRNEADQNKAFAEGFSRKRWPHGAHNRLPSLAVDVVPGPEYSFDDVVAFNLFAATVKDEWKALDFKGCKLVWGGDWTSFVDYPHWEIQDVAREPKVSGEPRDGASALGRLAGLRVVGG